jgi:hypothetical protein
VSPVLNQRCCRPPSPCFWRVVAVVTPDGTRVPLGRYNPEEAAAVEQALLALLSPAPTRGELINRKASTGAALVRAQEACVEADKRARGTCASSPERAACVAALERLERAERAHAEATAALIRAGGP